MMILQKQKIVNFFLFFFINILNIIVNNFDKETKKILGDVFIDEGEEDDKLSLDKPKINFKFEDLLKMNEKINNKLKFDFEINKFNDLNFNFKVNTPIKLIKKIKNLQMKKTLLKLFKEKKDINFLDYYNFNKKNKAKYVFYDFYEKKYSYLNSILDYIVDKSRINLKLAKDKKKKKNFLGNN